LSVQSALGESMRAEIEVTSMTAEEAANLRIRVAPPESYRAANVDYNPVLPTTRAVLERRPDGRQFVRLTSDRGVQEPFVDVILEISWATGRLVREYTLLFDPPITARSTAKPSGPATAAAPTFTSPIISAAPPMAPAATRAERRAAARSERSEPATEARVPARSAGAEADAYRVKSGDSLSRIAAHTQRSGVSLDQMLVALFRANPQAFMDNNMNRLKAGVVLAIPPADAALSVNPTQAHEIITAQSADFSAYRQRLAGAALPAQPEGNVRQASGKVQASVDDRKQAAAATPDKLTLSKGSVASAAQDDRLSKERERTAEAARVAELSKNVEQLKKLHGAASVPATVGAAPAVAAAASVASARPSTTIAAPPPVVVAQAPAPAAQPAAAVPSVVSPVIPAPSAAAAVPPVVTPAASAVAAAKPAAQPSAAKAPVAEPGLLGSLVDDNPLALGLGGLVIALLAGFGIYRYTKRAKRDSGETSFLESRLQPDSFFGASGGQR
ncbi:MAG: FimV/HubP family polar landmark protein, partial [Caldimonas sp.]